MLPSVAIGSSINVKQLYHIEVIKWCKTLAYIILILCRILQEYVHKYNQTLLLYLLLK